jgi:hypothetical protein
MSERVDRLTLFVGRTLDGIRGAGFVGRQGAGALEDPDVVVAIDGNSTDLADEPLVRKSAWPASVYDEPWSSLGILRRFGPVAQAVQEVSDVPKTGESTVSESTVSMSGSGSLVTLSHGSAGHEGDCRCDEGSGGRTRQGAP